MYDVISIGSISIDMYYRGDSLTEKEGRFSLAMGGKYQVDHFYAGLGGGAANVAIGIQSFGFSAALMGKVGENQFEDLIHKHLKEHKITSSLIQKEKDYMKISSILLSQQGERTILHYETPHEHILRTDKDLESLEQTKVIYMSNLWRVPLEERKRILAHISQKKILSVVNLGVADCRRPVDQLESLLHHVNVLIINTHEFSEIVKKPVESIDFKKDITDIFPLLKTKILVITDGSKGAYAYVDGGVLIEAAHEVTHVVDTTGAGDGFSAGFIAGYLEKNNVEYALHQGNKRGAHIVQKIGAN